MVLRRFTTFLVLPALLNQLTSIAAANLLWLADRAMAVSRRRSRRGRSFAVLCYVRQRMKKTVEDPDLVPGPRGFQWMPRFGNSLPERHRHLLPGASIARSRQHRVALAFYWSVVIAIALSWNRREA